MCGISGILNKTRRSVITQSALYSMIGKLHHRGPDCNGTYIDEHVGLAHARLSIIDLDGMYEVALVCDFMGATIIYGTYDFAKLYKFVAAYLDS